MNHQRISGYGLQLTRFGSNRHSCPKPAPHRLLAMLVLTTLLFAGLSAAQEFRGVILGEVRDSSGAVIPGATITAKGTQTPYTAKTSGAGDFSIPFVVPGTYDVTAEAHGFKKAVRTGVVIDVAQKVNLNFVLEVGAVTEEVTVKSDLVGVNTADASGGTVMDPEKVQNLPLNGRQVFQLMQLTPGVRFTTTSFGPNGNSGTRGWDTSNAYQINGVVNNLNQFELNGAPITQQTSTNRGAWQIAPNVDAVQEFKIQTNNYDATIGRTGGGTVNVVTKQGTNNFHGTLFDYWRNSIMEANVFQTSQRGLPRGFHNQHQFGGTGGGPILHNKTYFFGSFEGWREVTPAPITSTVPAGIVTNPDGSVDMSAFLKGQNPNSGGIYNPFACATTNADGTCATRQRLSWNGKNDVIPPGLVSPIGLKILALYPAPNQPGFVNNFVTTTGGRYRYNQPTIRVDHNFTDKTKLYGMFSWWSGTEFRNNGNGFPDLRVATGNIFTYRSYLGQILDLTHVFSPTRVGDIRVSLSRAKDRSPNGGLAAGLGGKLTPADLGLTTYPVPPTTDQILAPQITNNNASIANIIGNSFWSSTASPPLNETYEVSPTMTHVIGKHNLRYGGQFMQIYAIPCCGNGNSGSGAGPGGNFNFTDNFTRFNPNNASTNPAGNCPAGTTCTTGESMASLVLGIPANGSIPFILPIYEGYPYYATYFQDDWKVRSNLTLNVGLRWDVELSPDERYNRLNGGFCYTCLNPVTSLINFPAGNVLQLPNGTPTGLTMPNPINGGFTYIGNGRAPYDTQFNHFAPRFGISWGLGKKTVIRGGYGVNWAFAFELGGNTTFTQNTNYQATTGVGGTTPTTFFRSGNPYNGSDPAVVLTQPAGPANGLLSTVGELNTSYDQRNRHITRVQNYSFGIQRELPAGIVLDASYVGTYSGNIRVGVNFDNLTPAQITQCAASAAAGPNLCNSQVKNPFFHALDATSARNSPLNTSSTVAAWVLMAAFPQFNQTLFSNTEPVGFSDYNSLQVKVNKRFSGGGALVRGLSFLTSFTWSKNMVANGLNNNNNGQCPGCVDIAGPGTDALTPFIPKTLYQLDSNDRTFDLAFSGIYGLPIGKGGLIGGDAHGFVGQLINDWSAEWILTADTGTPIGPSNTVSFNCPQNNNSLKPAHQTFNEWLYNETPSCFTNLPNNTWIPRVATPRRNDLRNPYAPQLQFGLTKGFAVRENVNLQFKAEAFNLTNTPIFGGPNTGGQTSAIVPVFFTDPKTGQRTQVQPGQPGAFTGYGTISATQQNFPRQVQLSLKLLF
jgi:hypothetical protein